MWRAMASLIVLREQVNKLAPNRNRDADGLVGDAAHSARTSDHNPHDVDGVGRNIVTALDLTHDPAHGFDSYAFAELLRVNRDPRIEYVISNRRVFSSTAVAGHTAWTWRAYTGSSDPHTGHVHISVRDAPISDTRTPWTLEEPAMPLSPEDIRAVVDAVWARDVDPTPTASQAAYRALDAAQKAAEAALKAVNEVKAVLANLVIPAPAPVVVDPAALKAVLLDPEVLAANAKATGDVVHADLAD